METESPLKKIAKEEAARERAKFDALQAKRDAERKHDERINDLKEKLKEAVKDEAKPLTWDNPGADIVSDVRKSLAEMKIKGVFKSGDTFTYTSGSLIGTTLTSANAGQYVQMELFPKVSVEKGKSGGYYTLTNKESGPDLAIEEVFDYDDDGTAYYNIECKVEDKMSTLPQLKKNMSYAETRLRERLSADGRRVKGTVWFEYSVEDESIDVDAICNYEDVPGATRG